MIYFIGGAPCTGKSTLAKEIAYRLDITNIICTDTIRCVLRQAFTPDDYTFMYPESHEAWKAYSHKFTPDTLRKGFMAQCEMICTYVIGLIIDAKKYEKITLIEGVHALPSILSKYTTKAIVLDVPDVEEHKERLTGKKGSAKYKREFIGFRTLRDLILEDAEEAGVDVIDNPYKAHAIEKIVEAFS